MTSGIDALCKRLSDYLAPAQVDDVRRAYLFSAQAHEGQYRRNGDPYVTHPLAVADIPALREPVLSLTGGSESPALVASAVEFIFEGLHLNKRLNKDSAGGAATYRSRAQ